MSARDIQIGGSHYKGASLQPIDLILALELGFCEGSVIKYVSRWRDKGGVQDLKKAKHYIDFLIEEEEKKSTYIGQDGLVDLITSTNAVLADAEWIGENNDR